MVTPLLVATKRSWRQHRIRNAPRSLHHSKLSCSFLLIIFLLCGYHYVETAADESSNNDIKNNIKSDKIVLDVASAAMAQSLINRMKEANDASEKLAARTSWDTLIRILDSLASTQQITDNSNEIMNTDNTLKNIHHHLSQNEARQRALYWLSHQDTYEQKEGTGLLHRYALAVIYFSLEGDSWNRCSSASHSGTGSIKASDCPTENGRYLSSASHRTWDGVNGNRDDTITWLDLSNRNVYSEEFLPLELTLLSPTLELLWISENPGLSGTLPEYMGEFQKLESLNVHKTNVGGALPESLYTMNKLSSLRLYKSKFTGSISSNIGQMGRLKWLWIHDNEFTGMVPEQIGVLKKLEGVTLHGNKFAPIVREKSTVQENEDKALKEDANKEVNSQPGHDEQTDANYTNGGEEKQEDAVENNDWISTLKGNIIPESLCSLMSTKTLKHLWTDCEEKALVHASGEKSDLVIKEGAHACSCCTRCFPKMVSIPAE